LIEFPLIEKFFLGLKGSGEDDPDLFSVGAVHTKDTRTSGGHAQVEKPDLNRKPGRVRQKPDRKRILERFLDFLQRQRAIKIEWRIIPVELHIKGDTM
jgi:hypothetical protein